jgi:aspartate beta-hydroxylase
MQMIEKNIPREYHHSFLSAMNPDTHIIKHYGPTNKKLRFHLPILGVEGSRLRVDEEIMELKAGEAYVFDDSFEHEAWHDGKDTRVILIADLWHPDLTADEIKFLTMLQNARMKTEKYISEQDPDRDNFFSVIEDSRDLLGDDNDWWKFNEDAKIAKAQVETENDNADANPAQSGVIHAS